MTKLLTDTRLHAAFRITLFLKGALSAAEVAGGILIYLIPPGFILSAVHALARVELSDDPRDFIATWLLHAVQHLSVSGERFAAFYLLFHGVVKLWFIVGLWRGKRAYYPIAIAVFGLFIVYQIYRYTFTHSVLLLFITVLDAFAIWLTWDEYRRVLSATASAPAPQAPLRDSNISSIK